MQPSPPGELRPALAVALFAVLVAGGSVLLDDDPWELATPAPAVPLIPERLTELEDLTCTPCHATVVDEWASTAHALAWRDEVYQEHLASRRRPQLCYRCHIPQPLLAGGEPARPQARGSARHLGVSCDACHLAADGVILGARGVETEAHPTRRSEYLAGAGTNALCSTCHSTNIGPVIGVAKDFAAAGMAERGKSCVGCHLATRPLDPAGSDDPEGRTVKSHALQTPRDPAFLRRAFALRLELVDGTARVVISNRAGHRVPGLIGRSIRFTARVLDGQGGVLAQESLTLDVRHHLPVDGEVALEIEASGPRVTVVGDHTDPRQAEAVRFLETELEAE